MTRALFINSGILGQRTFAHFIDRAVVRGQRDVEATQMIVADQLSPAERVVRRLLCTELWPAGRWGMTNLDRHRFRAELNAGLIARRRIRRLERAGHRFDVLHFHRQATAYASLDRMRQTPAIVSIDCTQRCVVQDARSEVERRSYGPNIRRDGAIFRAAKLIVATSAWAAQSLREEYPDVTTDIAVMPNPVEVGEFDPEWIEMRYRRAQGPGYCPRVLFVGGDFVRKGGHDLLDAWRAGRFFERARLDIVSSWPIRNSDLGAGITVHREVASHSAAWRAAWREADVFVLPTHNEAFGIVLQEAAGAGLPAIATAINSIPETVVDGQTGLLVCPGDRTGLIDRLDRLIASADLRRELGTRGRCLIVRSADPDAYRDRLLDAIRRLART